MDYIDEKVVNWTFDRLIIYDHDDSRMKTRQLYILTYDKLMSLVDAGAR